MTWSDELTSLTWVHEHTHTHTHTHTVHLHCLCSVTEDLDFLFSVHSNSKAVREKNRTTEISKVMTFVNTRYGNKVNFLQHVFFLQTKLSQFLYGWLVQTRNICLLLSWQKKLAKLISSEFSHYVYGFKKIWQFKIIFWLSFLRKHWL